mgnify:CR=1 FL=1
MDTIPLLVSLDQAYLPQLQVLLTSLYWNNPGEQFAIYLLHSGIPAPALAPVVRQCEHLAYQFHPIFVEDRLFADAPTTKQYPKEMYYRLLAGSLLPRQLNRILYLDPDILVINPLRPLWEMDLEGRLFAAAAHTVGALFHTDAIQGYLHIPLDAAELGVDAMSVAAHKIGGPVASGALYVKTRTPLRPRIFGGGQEAGRRAGTQDLRTQLAFAAAARTLAPHVAQERTTLQALSDKLYATLTAHPRIHATMGDYTQADRLPGMVSIYIDGMDSEELIIKLDAAGFEVSAGSACSSGSMDPSHVLSAMGIGREQALGALRISFDDRVNPSDLDEFAQTLLSIVGAA